MCKPIKTDGKKPSDLYEGEDCLVLCGDVWRSAYISHYYDYNEDRKVYAWLIENGDYVPFEDVEWYTHMPSLPVG